MQRRSNPPRCNEYIIKCIKKNRQLPESIKKNPEVTDYLKQLEMKGLLNAEILGVALKEAAYLDHLDCLYTIIRSDRFSEISAEDLGKALRYAAMNAHFDCLIAICSDRFADISAEDLERL